MKRSDVGAGALVALASFLPFLPGVVLGRCFFFRDLSRQFFPLRRFAVEGLLRGEVRLWNPYLHEGVPLSLPALSYPLDLLQLLVPNEFGFSLLLALHVPLGALAFLALGRGLGLAPLPAAGGAIVYGLGGFYLSTLNLYVYLQAAAWAPLVVLGLLRAADSPRWRAAAALAVAVSLSTTGAEIVAQAVVVGLALAFTRREPTRLRHALVALALGVGMAAPTLALLRLALADSARAQGFPTAIVLAHSIDPWSLGQLVIGNWHGDLADLANQWWGSRFFPTGFPYFLSFYIGASAIILAAVGALHGMAPRGRLLALAGGALVVSLGRFAGLGSLVAVLPLVDAFRYPAKAFFIVHLAVALLAALGVERLASGRGWRTAAAFGVALGGLLVALGSLPVLLPSLARWFLAGFLPPSYTWPQRTATADSMLADAARGGAFAVLVTGIALLVVAGRLAPSRAALASVVLVAADLLRTGAGLNRSVTPGFYAPSPEMAPLVRSLGSSSGRLFSCDPEACPAYFWARRQRSSGHDAWTFSVMGETLTPAFNVNIGVASALSRDLTMLVPTARTLTPEEAGPMAPASHLERLRAAGVSHVLCLERIESPELRLLATAAPLRIAPLSVHLYALTGPLPLRALARQVRAVEAAPAVRDGADLDFQSRGGVSVEGPAATTSEVSGGLAVVEDRPDRIRLQVEADRPSVVVVRDAYASGWHATVNGAAAPIWRADGRHRAVPIPAGRSDVVVQYAPPSLAAALGLAAMSALTTALSARRWRRGPAASR